MTFQKSVIQFLVVCSSAIVSLSAFAATQREAEDLEHRINTKYGPVARVFQCDPVTGAMIRTGGEPCVMVYLLDSTELTSIHGQSIYRELLMEYRARAISHTKAMVKVGDSVWLHLALLSHDKP